MTKKHLLFALIVCMSTVWRFLELLEYGEIEVRQVDTWCHFGFETETDDGGIIKCDTLPE